MRNINLILIGLMLTINLSAQTCRKVLQMKGVISNKYPIVMTLTIENEHVFGFYYYEKYKTKILLEGQITDDKVTLMESPDHENQFKTGFMGTITDSIFSGNWVDKPHDKMLKFELKIKLDKPMNLSKDIAAIEGTYESLYNSDKYFGSVVLRNITDELFYFEISNGTESGCTGFLKGLVELNDFKKGVFSTDLCEKLEFKLLNNELNLIENNCDLHGMICPFNGEYKKISI